ncbi:MAG: hypothetical protein DSY42_03910 [Aquifex sp.]|nr:MAG: hypothetical protein DSY42_03910 [Aquifex sp.]
MRLKYILLSGLILGLFACEQPKNKGENKAEAPKTEEVKQQTKKETTETKQEETKTVAHAGKGNPDKGKAIFNSKGCSSCHQPAADTVGPSLKKIAQAYGSVDELVKYFKREAKPRVWPEKAAIMNPQLMQLKGLSEGELKDLASFILSHK